MLSYKVNYQLKRKDIIVFLIVLIISLFLFNKINKKYQLNSYLNVKASYSDSYYYFVIDEENFSNLSNALKCYSFSKKINCEEIIVSKRFNLNNHEFIELKMKANDQDLDEKEVVDLKFLISKKTMTRYLFDKLKGEV